jgi:hypothetical protein
MPAHEWAVMSLNKVYRDHKKYPDNKVLEGMSDSLFKLLGRTKWGITDFSRLGKEKGTPVRLTSNSDSLIEIKSKTDMIKSLQKEHVDREEDTIYYRNVFIDLFANDPEFSKKFPFPNYLGGTTVSFNVGRVTSYQRQKDMRNIYMNGGMGVDTVLLLEPFYFSIDERDKQSMKYITSDNEQEKLVKTLDLCGSQLGVTMIKFDPNLMSANDVEKINEFSVINDWFDERFDSEIESKAILNTDEIGKVMSKYGTHYVFKTGMAYVVNEKGSKKTYVFGFLFDLKKNTMVYRKYEIFSTRDRKDLVHAKLYQMVYELKHPARRKKPG